MLKKVYGFYALFTVMLLAGAAISIAFSLVFGKKDLFFNMIFSSEDRLSAFMFSTYPTCPFNTYQVVSLWVSSSLFPP